MSLNLAPTVLAALKALSEMEKRSPEAIVSDLILARYESLAIDPKILEALNAQMADFQATGDAYDWDEVSAWMGSWFTDHEKPEPRNRNFKSTK
ncbi:MAG: hypothetical protein LBT38_08185 [Deltaproteobacteria bacterium]|jgi:predicted transcriptional regulator|nr:hypothetical protein [Deltaproteobacteria bacterium]